MATKQEQDNCPHDFKKEVGAFGKTGDYICCNCTLELLPDEKKRYDKIKEIKNYLNEKLTFKLSPVRIIDCNDELSLEIDVNPKGDTNYIKGLKNIIISLTSDKNATVDSFDLEVKHGPTFYTVKSKLKI